MNRNDAKTLRRSRAGHAAGLVLAAAVALAATACQSTPPAPGPSQGSSATTQRPDTSMPTNSPSNSSPHSTEASGRPGHVFVINLENKGYEEVWGSGSAAPYLSTTLRGQGVLLTRYYGIAHNSHPDYLAQISGQGSNEMTRHDCPVYAPFEQTGTAEPGQVEGHRLRVPGVGPDGRGPAQRRGQNLERLHGGHGRPLPAS